MYSSGYMRRPNTNKVGPRKRKREFKINEFVDSSRAIIGSSQEDSDGKGSVKVVNSDEENNIITKKPVVRAPERRMLQKTEDGTEDDTLMLSSDNEEKVVKRRKARKEK